MTVDDESGGSPTSPRLPEGFDPWSELAARGVGVARELCEAASPELIWRAVQFYDATKLRQPSVDAALLVSVIRRGRVPEVYVPSGGSQAEVQREYGEGIVRWLRDNFPEFNDAGASGTHAAAVAAVVRLDHLHSKRRDAKVYGPEIRQAVKRWEEAERDERF